jgi:hypothetical protein
VSGTESAKELIIAAKQDVEEAEEVLGKMEMEIRRCLHVCGVCSEQGWNDQVLVGVRQRRGRKEKMEREMGRERGRRR